MGCWVTRRDMVAVVLLQSWMVKATKTHSGWRFEGDTSSAQHTLRLMTLLLQQLYCREAKGPHTHVFITPRMAKAPQSRSSVEPGNPTIDQSLEAAMEDNMTIWNTRTITPLSLSFSPPLSGIIQQISQLK